MEKLEEIKLTPAEKFIILKSLKGSPFISAKRLYFYHRSKSGDEFDKKIDEDFKDYLENVRIAKVDVDDLMRKVLDHLKDLGIRYSETVVRDRINEFLNMKIIKPTKKNTMLDFTIIKILTDEGKLRKIKRGLYIWNQGEVEGIK
jgi:hypothetical protein